MKLVEGSQSNLIQNNFDTSDVENRDLSSTIQRLKDKVFEKDLQIAANKTELNKQEGVLFIYLQFN